MIRPKTRSLRLLGLFAIAWQASYLHAEGMALVAAPTAPPAVAQRMVEWTMKSQKRYSDPFNEVEVDVIFSRGDQTWRVPTFWRGGQRWTVRFAPPSPGEYTYYLESTDGANPDLNGHRGQVTITPYAGDNPLLKHGMLRVSATKRYLEHSDGTPFFWLGDTWWMGLSDRLPWSGFQQLTADRKAKGFTVVQIVAGLVPTEELCPEDPGCRNEGGAVWEPGFTRINPGYFDAADRRIQFLINAGIVPEIEGAYSSVLAQTGVAKMKQHWRYVIARYGAYPVLWNLSDDLADPPPSIASRVPKALQYVLAPPGWTEIARYVRSTDPYHLLLTVNEGGLPFDAPIQPLQDETLTDFDQIQPTHWGWPTLGTEVVQLDKHYARTDLTKPVVVGEIGYDNHFATHLENFQRAAFWLAMLNGAAGHTYGAAPTFEVNNPDKPLHRTQYTFMTWEEGMRLPGSYQLGLSAKLLRQYPWWQFAPHPEWITPGGTTLLEPHKGRDPAVDNFDWATIINENYESTDDFLRRPETMVPGGEWQARGGTFRRPYAAGIPGKIRVVYIPTFGLGAPTPPTVLELERDVRYHAYYWDPILGIKFDLGAVQIPAAGAIELQDDFEGDSRAWSEHASSKGLRQGGQFVAKGETMSVVNIIKEQDCVVDVDARGKASTALLLRYLDADNYVAAVFSAKEKTLYMMTRLKGINSGKLGAVPVSSLDMNVHLSTEVRANWGAASLTDGKQTYSTPIVDISGSQEVSLLPIGLGQTTSGIFAGSVGLWHQDDGLEQHFKNFRVRRSPAILPDDTLNRKLYDARGIYRGELSGPGWDQWGRSKTILLSAYRAERFPTFQDWVLVLDAASTSASATRPNTSMQ